MQTWITITLLCCSNVFMTFAWYGHLKEPGPQTLDRCGTGQLGHCLVRIPPASPGQPYRPSGDEPRSAQNPARGHHPLDLRSLLDSIHEGKTHARLPLGRPLYPGSRVLSLSRKTDRPIVTYQHIKGMSASSWGLSVNTRPSPSRRRRWPPVQGCRNLDALT